MKDIRYIVWDWNGTLIDDVSCAVESMNTLLGEHSISPGIDEDSYKETFGFPVIDYYRKIGFDVEDKNFSKVAERFIMLYDENYKKCHLHEGAEQVMLKLKEKGIGQIILSASEKNNLLKQVANFNIAGHVEEILGIDDIYAGSKEYLAVNWLSENHIDPRQVLFIGDTAHDYEVASRSGCQCILIAKGHQSRTILEQFGVPVIGHHQELLDYFITG